MFSFFLAEKWNIIKYILLLAEPEIFVGQVKCIKQKFNRKNITYYISILHRFCLNLLSLLTINSSFYFIISYSNLILLATISLSSYFLYKFLATLFPPTPSPQSIPRSAITNKWEKKIVNTRYFFYFVSHLVGFFIIVSTIFYTNVSF